MAVKRLYNRIYGKPLTITQKALYYKFMNFLLRKYGVNRYKLVYQHLPSGESLLDIGCGDDFTLMPLSNKYTNIWGIDIKNIDNIIPPYNFKTQDINAGLLFPPSSFDTVLMMAVLEHLLDPVFILSECFRVLRLNGYVLILVPNVIILGNRLRFLFGHLPITSDIKESDGGHLHYFTTASLTKLVIEAGFSIKCITSGGIFAQHGMGYLSSLCDSDILIIGVKK